MKSLGLLYDDDGYIETPGQPLGTGSPTRTGLLGRQVAGQEFLAALYAHGRWEQLVALVRNRASVETLSRDFTRRTAGATPARNLLMVSDDSFPAVFHPTPPTRLIFNPCPPDLRYAWARHHHSSHGYALCGVTHTLSSQRAAEWLGQLLIGPFEPYDALICTSQAVLRMVRASADAYADFLRDRVGGEPRIRMRLDCIPLGVDTDRYHPASPGERALSRESLGIAPDEIVVLFVGRLSHHTKAHPFPLFHAVDQAARATDKKVRLLMAGWAHNDAVFQAFRAAATAIAPNVNVNFVDGTRPENRQAVWHAADIFSSLSDNIQETFGLVVIEALASGLPVVASDWDGYRDLVTDGETGYIIPTCMIPGATADANTRLVLESHTYEHFLAECSQAVTVDSTAAARVFTRLISDETERRRLGTMARRAALLRFSWAEVIRAYERLWDEQEVTRQEFERIQVGKSRGKSSGLYPSPEVAFEGYPTRWLSDDIQLAVVPGAVNRLVILLELALVTHAAWARHTDAALLRAILSGAAEQSLASLMSILTAHNPDPARARATLAWMLKYDLLRPTS